ncbi:hypothetical protein CK203_047509 [Vitis vinifera]|uniref:Uncharacterized protein n=1 Tax=Vitis vinifera TaxID=29760 RepID=A0A438H5X4_VITVI|nr:hypothetical protein CK203_047509 [Vitis vinifera]
MLIVSYITLGQLFYMTYFYMPSVKVQEQSESIPHLNVSSVASTSSASDDAIEVFEAHVSETSETMLRLASFLTRNVAALRSCHCGSDENSSIPCPNIVHHAGYEPRCETLAKQPLVE